MPQVFAAGTYLHKQIYISKSFYLNINIYIYVLAEPGQALLWLILIKCKKIKEKAHISNISNLTVFVHIQYFVMLHFLCR